MDFPRIFGDRERADGERDGAGAVDEEPFGEWSEIVRILSDYDPDRAERVFRVWPIREALLAYDQRERKADLERYRFEILAYGLGTIKDPPEIPDSLRGGRRGDSRR